MNVNKLRELIRTGEFLEQDFTNDTVRSQWTYDVENYIKISNIANQEIATSLSTMRFHGSHHFSKERFNSIMGFLRHLYNNSTSENKLIPKETQSVFIVHGHDDNLISDVKSSISELGLHPIVLREQQNKGLTIIEKLVRRHVNVYC